MNSFFQDRGLLQSSDKEKSRKALKHYNSSFLSKVGPDNSEFSSSRLDSDNSAETASSQSVPNNIAPFSCFKPQSKPAGEDRLDWGNSNDILSTVPMVPVPVQTEEEVEEKEKVMAVTCRVLHQIECLSILRQWRLYF
jgi:hypothetical protein